MAAPVKRSVRSPGKRKGPKARLAQEAKARAAERLQRYEKRIASFRRAYGAVGIVLDDETLARMAAQEPIDIRCRFELDPDEEDML